MGGVNETPRVFAAAGVGLLCAAGVAPLVDTWDDHNRVFLLCLLAAVVAIARALTRGHRYSGPVTDAALALLFGLGVVDKPGAWFPVLGGVGLGTLALAAALHLVGPRITLAVTGVAITGAIAAGVPQRFGGVHAWNQYHYVLGTKYFAEVGYQDLYVATLLADADGEKRLEKVSKLRDMRTYFLVTREDALARAEKEGLRARFTDARWAEFKHDTDFYVAMLGPKVMPGVLTDLGFNPSPAWVILNQPLLWLHPLDRDYVRTLAALQIPMFLAVLAIGIWAFGARTTLWLVLWNVLFFGSRGRLYGGYWSYDWFALAILATADRKSTRLNSSHSSVSRMPSSA